MFWHVHCLGSDPRCPGRFRAAIRDWGKGVALGRRRSSEDPGEGDEDEDPVEELNALRSVRDAAAYYSARIGAVSVDPSGSVAAHNPEYARGKKDVCAVRQGDVPQRGHAAGVWRAHLEAEVQHHRCKSAPALPAGAPAGAGGAQGKSYCLRPNSKGA